MDIVYINNSKNQIIKIYKVLCFYLINIIKDNIGEFIDFISKLFDKID